MRINDPEHNRAVYGDKYGLTTAEAIAQIREALTNLDGSKTGKGLTALDSLEAEVEKCNRILKEEIQRGIREQARRESAEAENERLRAVVEAARSLRDKLKSQDMATPYLDAALAKLTEGEA